MTELELKIQGAAQKYYSDGSSDLTDEEFDALVDQLKLENPASELLAVGWGYRPNKDSTPGEKYHHRYITIGSLDKCHNLEELGNKFHHELLDASLKLDGISVVLYYENGELVHALTRGDGQIGIDVTDKILCINPSLDTCLTGSEFTGAVRGEIVMSYDNFEEFKKLHPEAKNPRNSTAGLINGKDTFSDLKFLNIIFYTLIHSNQLADQAITLSNSREFLKRIFGSENVVPSHLFFIGTSEINEYAPRFFRRMDIESGFLDYMDHLQQEMYGTYPADGIVITKDVLKYTDGTLEYTAKAFKFPSEIKETMIEDIEWNMSKTRYAIPKILLSPIELAGTTVKACSGFHAKYIEENGLGRGSKVKVRKSGEIIPQIIDIVSPSGADLPRYCPDCHHPLSWKGVHLVCTNENCSNSNEQDLLVWMQNLAPTDNLGDTLKMKFINQMIDSKVIGDSSIESVMGCNIVLPEDGSSAQENTFAKMWNNLHTQKVSLSSALIACNIPRIGDLTAIKVAKHPEAILKLLDSSYEDVERDIEYISKLFGDANAVSISNNFNKLLRLNMIRNRIIWENASVESKGKVAITGKLSVKRPQFEQELRQAGYEPSEISKDTKFLITDDPDGSSSKNKKATSWGIEKVTEHDFRSKYL